ncbi:MAG: O-antigen ligase family protein, partial [bacterium]|nr:O-antigen ligase family protein [bacterium]
IVILISLIIAVGIVHRYSERNPGWLKRQVYSLSDVHQFQERFLIWQIGFKMIQAHPVWGLGASGFRINFMEELSRFMEKEENQMYVSTVNGWRGSNANQAHNDYLQFTVDFGLVGLALFFWFIATLFWFGINSIKAQQDPIEKLQIAGLFLALLAILIDALVNFPFMLPANGLPFWIILAILSNRITAQNQSRFSWILEIRRSRNSGKSAVRSQKSEKLNLASRFLPLASNLLIRIVGSIVVLILSMILLTSIYHSVQANILLKKGRNLVRLGQMNPALAILQKSAKLDPFENETRFALGLVEQNSGQLESAIQQYHLAYGYDYRKYVNLGETYFLVKNYPAAVVELEKAARVYPADPDAPRMLGVIYSRYLNQPDKAIMFYEQYLNLVEQPEDGAAIVQEIKRLNKKVHTDY